MPMNNTIDFNTAKTIGTMSKKSDHIDDTVSSFFSFMHMVMQNELGNAEPYFAATSPVLDLTVIRPDDAPHILPCFDEADEGISISEDEPLGFRYNPKQVIKLMGKRYLVGPVIFHRFDDDGNFASLTMSDMYAINHNLVYRVQEDGTCTNHVNSPKTKAGIRIIPMIDEVFDAFLEEYQYQKVIGFCTDEIDGYSGFVFCTGDGKVYLPNAINRTIRSICADYNKEEESKAKEENRDPVLLPKFSCHILRHTFCTRFCENETNLKVIQEIMGHADISTTMDVYAEATQEKKKESMTSLQSALLVR